MRVTLGSIRNLERFHQEPGTVPTTRFYGAELRERLKSSVKAENELKSQCFLLTEALAEVQPSWTRLKLKPRPLCAAVGGVACEAAAAGSL